MSLLVRVSSISSSEALELDIKCLIWLSLIFYPYFKFTIEGFHSKTLFLKYMVKALRVGCETSLLWHRLVAVSRIARLNIDCTNFHQDCFNFLQTSSESFERCYNHMFQLLLVRVEVLLVILEGLLPTTWEYIKPWISRHTF